MKSLADAELRLRDAASKKILLEVALLKAIEARNAVSLDSVLKQLNQLRGQGGAGGPACVPDAAEAAPAADAGLRPAESRTAENSRRRRQEMAAPAAPWPKRRRSPPIWPSFGPGSLRRWAAPARSPAVIWWTPIRFRLRKAF